MTRPAIAAIVLAAGRSRRLDPLNKLLVEFDGVPLVARAVDAALASRAGPVIVVTGYQGGAVAAALAGRPVRIVESPDYAEGLSASLKAGLAAVPGAADGALVLLADMPGITAGLIDRLIEAYAPAAGRSIIVPVCRGRRGNPVLWDRRFFPEIGRLSGDRGARDLLQINSACIATVAVDDDGVLDDVDSPDDLARLQNRRPGPDR